MRRAIRGVGVLCGVAFAVTACGQPQPSVTTSTVVVTASAAAAPPTSATSGASPTEPSEAVDAGDWAGVVHEAERSVVRLEVATCDERWMGTGFSIGSGRIVTAAHVAEGAVSIGVQGQGFITTAEVVDLDKDADVAVLQARDALPAGLSLAPAHAPLGSALALLGYPNAVTDLRITQGVVSGVNASVDYGPASGIALTDVLATDAAINGGNSGGPALNRAGQVVGLVTGKAVWSAEDTPVEGTGYVVPSDQLVPRIAAWTGETPRGNVGCDGSDGPLGDAGPVVDVRASGAAAQDIARSLATHGAAINTGNYDVAWMYFTDREQKSLTSLEAWADGLVSSRWEGLTLESATVSGDTATTRVLLTTTQDAEHGPKGQVCSEWQITYRMQRLGAAWLIDTAKAPTQPTPCTG